MSLQYSGGTIVDTTFTSDGTRLNLVNNLNTQLKNAGWTAISGDGTGDVLMKSAVTAQGVSIRFRLLDPGSGNCAQVTMKNNAGTLTSAIGYILPSNGQSFRIWANKHWFAIYASGGVNQTAARWIYIGGTVVSLNTGQITSLGSDLDVGWAQYTGNSDSTTTGSNRTFRYSLWETTTGGSAVVYGSSLYASQMVNYTGDAHASPRLLTLWAAYPNVQGCYRWQDNSNQQIEPLIAWSSSSSQSGETKIVGILSDAMVVGGAYVGESTISFDSHTWRAITNSAPVSGLIPGCTLFMRTDT